MTNLITNLIEQIYNTDQVVKKVNVSGGIIFKEQRGEKPALLLIQRAKDDHWPNFFEFPRGKCDNGPNEGLISCLKREVKEETGLDIIPLKFIDKFSYTADEGKRLSTQHNYLCKMKDPNQKIKLSKEHQGFQWITTPGEAEMTVLPEMKRSIIKAFELIDPDTQLVNYPENNFTPDGTIEENDMIKLYEDATEHEKRKLGPKRRIGGNVKKFMGKPIDIIRPMVYKDVKSQHKLKSDNPKMFQQMKDKHGITMKPSLIEKIKLSEDLVDKYINESVGNTINTIVNTGAYAASAGAAVSGELRRGYDWVQQKIKERNRKRMIAKQEKERMKKEKMRLAMQRKYEQKAKKVGTL